MAAATIRILALAAMLLPAPAIAQTGDLGRITYALHCTSCHGAHGRGDGPMAVFLTVPPANLTEIQRRNGGVFPFERVYRTIETGAENAVHAASAMPAWKDELLTETLILEGIEVEPGRREAFVRSRILALIDYIAQLQQN
jgi:mono/diheme cytochrome c family protein